LKVISYHYQGKSGVGVVAGANGVIALSKAAPNLPDDLRKILEIDPTLATVRAATNGKTANLSLNDIEFDPVIREPHATWALALNYKLHIEETGLTTSYEYPQIFLRMPICQVAHKSQLWAPSPKIAEAYDYEGELAVITASPDVSSSASGRSIMSRATLATMKVRCASTRATTANSAWERISSAPAASGPG
jgi:2-keto-4-pentenoate hydratase/2-oxohepta-3-ene-1,7-dioic acid hydratase in catechol pathway